MLLFHHQDIAVEDQIRVLALFGKVSDETHDGAFHTFVSNVLPNGLFGDHVGFAISQNLEVRQQPRCYRVGDQARDTLFKRQRIGDPANVPCSILDADKDRTAGRVGESNDRRRRHPSRRDDSGP